MTLETKQALDLLDRLVKSGVKPQDPNEKYDPQKTIAMLEKMFPNLKKNKK